MAASTFVPARRSTAVPRALAAVAAARTAPRGAGLAPVIALPVRGAAVLESGAQSASGPIAPTAPMAPAAPALRLAPMPASARTRKRAGALAASIAVVVLAVAGIVGTALAGSAELEVAGHVVLQPGETLWDVAIRSAPAGVDPRRQLDDLRRVNGFGPGALDAWTVVLIPAR